MVQLTTFVVVMASQASSASDREEQDRNPIPAAVDSASSYTSTLTADGAAVVKASFRSFGGDAVSIDFALEADAGNESMREFGVSAEELDALMRKCQAMPGCDQEEFNRNTERYYRQHALRLRQDSGKSPRLSVDVAEVVQRNRTRVQPVATALRQLASERGHGPEWMVEAAVALVQTALNYREPSLWENGRKILGFYPPARALERGYGDCDTKSALLAAILLNLTDSRVVGVHVPQHYLIGIADVPDDGQAFISYAGERYVLVEAAGPGKRRPGDIAHKTYTALQQPERVRVDPMF